MMTMKLKEFYLQLAPIMILKIKKEVPTVIEFNGRRYVLDHKN